MNGAQCDDVLLTADTDKPYVSQRMTVSADKYHSYLNLTAPSDEESGDESVQEEFKRWPHIPHNNTMLQTSDVAIMIKHVPLSACPPRLSPSSGWSGPRSWRTWTQRSVSWRSHSGAKSGVKI